MIEHIVNHGANKLLLRETVTTDKGVQNRTLQILRGYTENDDDDVTTFRSSEELCTLDLNATGDEFTEEQLNFIAHKIWEVHSQAWYGGYKSGESKVQNEVKKALGL